MARKAVGACLAGHNDDTIADNIDRVSQNLGPAT